MNELEKLDNQMFQALTDSESHAILGGAVTFIGYTEHGENECLIDYRSGDDAEYLGPEECAA